MCARKYGYTVAVGDTNNIPIQFSKLAGGLDGLFEEGSDNFQQSRGHA
jgi:hypothetical protein